MVKNPKFFEDIICTRPLRGRSEDQKPPLPGKEPLSQAEPR